MPQRLAQIKHWLKTELQADIHRIEPASNDASFRRYFRVSFNNQVAAQEIGQTFVIMDAPPEKEAITPFINIARALEATGVHVPHLYAVNDESGFILMSDLGNSAYLSLLNAAPGENSGQEQADSLYRDAMQALVAMQKGMQKGIQKENQSVVKLPDYDAALLRAEMNLLPDWYIKVHCQISLNDADQNTLEQAMKRLIQSAQEQPQVFVHRDYHSRNLMVCAERNPGIIDFQDAVIGPISYDLVSLLRDSYIAWSDEKVYQWLEQYRQMLLKEGLLAEDNKQQFIRWFDWMGIQRQLKVVGIFCRLNYRDGKNNYLNDIPQTQEYLFKVCARYPEFEALLELLKRLENNRLDANKRAQQ